MPAASPWVKEATEATFEQEVIETSERLPVVVDFWAPWCGPCRMLGPVLEQLAAEYDGKFLLVKVDTEQSPGLAAAFGVQSIPYVVAIHRKQLVNQFMGALPEARIREWLERIMPSPADQTLQSGLELEATDPAAAEGLFRKALDLQGDLADARIALARVLIARHRHDEARAEIAELESRGYLEPEGERVKSLLAVESVAEAAGGVDAAQAAAADAPDDLSLQLRLADALAATGQHVAAMDICLEVLARDRAGAGNEARSTMVNILNLLPGDSPLVSEYRRKLASALY